jgi:hypothetical protein
MERASPDGVDTPLRVGVSSESKLWPKQQEAMVTRQQQATIRIIETLILKID